MCHFVLLPRHITATDQIGVETVLDTTHDQPCAVSSIGHCRETARRQAEPQDEDHQKHCGQYAERCHGATTFATGITRAGTYSMSLAVGSIGRGAHPLTVTAEVWLLRSAIGHTTTLRHMLITGLETRIVELPLARPVGTAIHQMQSVGCVLVTIRTDDFFGQGFAFALNGDRVRAFDETIRGLEHLVVGQDARNVEHVFATIWNTLNAMGHKGITIGALCAIDVALWDIIGKAANMPLSKLFGGMRDSVDTYASSGLWLSDSVDAIVEEAQHFVATGFRAMKIRIGSSERATDVARVRAVRDAVGSDVDLYVDANQGLTPKDAIRLGRQLEEFNLVWFEEPVAYTDLAGHVMVRTALDTPIASGETEYTRFGMQQYLDAGAVDVLMPDLQRMGGFSEFRRAAALASTHNVPVSPHFFTEYSLSLAGSLPNCVSVEHVDWFQPLFNESLELVDGQLVIPDRPGTGFTFAQNM